VANFNTICTIIAKVELGDLFDGKDGSMMTVFAPTDQAFEMAGITPALINNDPNNKYNNADFLQKLLKTHATPGSMMAEDLRCGDSQSTLLGGASTHITKCFADTHGKAQFGFFNSNDAPPMIMSPMDIELCNGLIQPVEHVIKLFNF